jgi:hypothetical protein
MHRETEEWLWSLDREALYGIQYYLLCAFSFLLASAVDRSYIHKSHGRTRSTLTPSLLIDHLARRTRRNKTWPH